jgi:hypothetical protein
VKLAVAVLFACGGAMSAKIVSLADANANLGKQVSIYGRAGNAKLSAIVQTEGNVVIYCLDTPAWPVGVDGTWITAHGTLEQHPEYVAKTDASGAISQGTGEPIWALANCRVE